MQSLFYRFNQNKLVHNKLQILKMQQFGERRDAEFSYNDRRRIFWLHQFGERRDTEFSYDDRRWSIL